MKTHVRPSSSPVIRTLLGFVHIVLAAMLPAAEAADAETAPLHGRGTWGVEARQALPVQRWQMEALRIDGGRILGEVELSGSALATRGNLVAEILGNGVRGAIRDDAGLVLIRFEGSRRHRGVSGRYQDRTGEAGEWIWEGQVPPW